MASKAKAQAAVQKRENARAAMSKSWYSGDKPTARETLAHIYTITDGDDVGRKTLYDKFTQEQNTKGSAVYNPYSKATNTKAIQGLTDLGFDLSGGVNQKFLEDNIGLRNYDRTASAYSPLAPSKSSTRAQDAAYYYNKLQDAEERTVLAENEWSAMQNELTYWAKNGLSDKEALSKINWKNYPTLRKMDEGRLSGDPVILNRGIGYSEDAMYGTLWAARNNGGTGNAMADAVLSVQGKGNAYKADPVAEAKRNPASKDFNPYTRPTIDAALMRYGVDSIDDAWLEANRGMLNDPEQAEEWQDLYKINENTKAAKDEYDKLMGTVNNLLNSGMTPEQVAGLKGNSQYSHLWKMDEARQMGEAYALSQPLDYRWEDVESYIYTKAERLKTAKESVTSPEAMAKEQGLRKEEYVAANGSLLDGDAISSVKEELESTSWFYNKNPEAAKIGREQAFDEAINKPKTPIKVTASAGVTDISSEPAKPQPLTADEEKRLAQVEEELAGYGQMKDELFANMDEVSAQNAWAPYSSLYNELFIEREKLAARKDAAGVSEAVPEAPEQGTQFGVKPGAEKAAETVEAGIAKADAVSSELPDGEFKRSLDEQKNVLQGMALEMQAPVEEEEAVPDTETVHADKDKLLADYEAMAAVSEGPLAELIGQEHINDISDEMAMVRLFVGDGYITKGHYEFQQENPALYEKLSNMDRDELRAMYDEYEASKGQMAAMKKQAVEMMHDTNLSVDERLYLGSAVGAYTECAELAFNAYRESLGEGEIPEGQGAQATALMITDYLMQDGMTVDKLVGKVPMDEETYKRLAQYDAFIKTAYDIKDESFYAFKFAEDAMGGQLRGSQFNEGVDFFTGLMTAATLGAKKFNKMLSDVISTGLIATGGVLEGSEWVVNNLVRKPLKMAESNAGSKALYKAATDLSKLSSNDLSEYEDFMLTEGTAGQIMAMTAGSEFIKMGASGKLGGMIGEVFKGATPALQTAMDANKMQFIADQLAMSPFTAESMASTTVETFNETGDALTSVLCGVVSGIVTASTADLGVTKDVVGINDPTAGLFQTLISAPGAGYAAGVKRAGKAFSMFVGNLFTKGLAGEGAQELIEGALTTAGTAVVKGEKLDLGELVKQGKRDFVMGSILGLVGELGVMPQYSKTWIAAEQYMKQPTLSDADVQYIVEAYEADMQDPVVVSAMEKATEEVVEATLFANNMAQQAEQVQKLTEAVTSARAKLDEAKKRFDEAQSEVDNWLAKGLSNPTQENREGHKAALLNLNNMSKQLSYAKEKLVRAQKAGAAIINEARAQAKAQMQAVAEAQEQAQVQATAEAQTQTEVAPTAQQAAPVEQAVVTETSTQAPAAEAVAPPVEQTAAPETVTEVDRETLFDVDSLPTSEQAVAGGTVKQRQFGSEKAPESSTLSDQAKLYVYQDSGYTTDSNRAQIRRNLDKVKHKGYDGALKDWLAGKDGDLTSADAQAMGVTLMAIAAHEGRVEDEVLIADRYNRIGTILGQGLQARKIFNMLTPLGAVAFVQKQVTNINDNLRKRAVATEVKLSPESLKAITEAKTAEERQAATDNALKEVAKQVPPTWQDRLTAWRYLSMLGNPRTHFRNYFGNAMFVPAVSAKNKLAAGLERWAMKTGFIDHRTKTGVLRVKDEYRDFAKADAERNKAWLLGEGKYGEANIIDQQRKSFGNSPLGKAAQKAYDVNNDLLSREDWRFLSMHYRHALAGWLQANNINLDKVSEVAKVRSTEASATRIFREGEVVHAIDRGNYGKIVSRNEADNSYQVHFVSPEGHEATVKLSAEMLLPTKTKGTTGDYAIDIAKASPHEILDAARMYAYVEAQKATYRDVSEFCKALNKLSRDKDTGKLTGWGYLIEGILPFKKTPVNILKRGIEYSPVGLLTTIVKWGKQCAKVNKAREVAKIRGEEFDASEFMTMTGNDFIDGLASGLTGTASMALGILLSNLGWVVGSQSDDPEDKFWKLLGRQEYSVEINGVSYTVDWATPISMPVLAGVATAEFVRENGWSMDVLWKGMQAVGEPIFNLSMLDGVTRLIESASYAEENGTISVLTDGVTGYLEQFVPTFLGQLARTIDPVRRTVTVDPDNPLPKDVQYFIGSIMNKIPFASMNSQPYINEWGEMEVDESPWYVRVFKQMVSPGYFSEVKPDATEQGLLDLAKKKTGETPIFPTTPKNSFSVDGKKVKLSPEEYTAFKQDNGQRKKKLYDELMLSPEFQSLLPNYQAEAINMAETYADKVSKYRAVSGYKLSNAEYDAYLSGNDLGYILDKATKAQMDDVQKAGYAEANKAIAAGDTLALSNSVELLKLTGAKEKVINNNLVKNAKKEYIKAWKENDMTACAQIKASLTDQVDGLDTSVFDEWDFDAYREMQAK